MVGYFTNVMLIPVCLPDLQDCTWVCTESTARALSAQVAQMLSVQHVPLQTLMRYLSDSAAVSHQQLMEDL